MKLEQALLAAQGDMPHLQRDAINPHFKSKFISLDTLMENVLPVLNKHGLVLLQLPTTVDGQPALRTRLVHAESGEGLEDTMLLMAAKDDPQGQGSAITYARRYSLMSTLGLVADEDDDGNKATAAKQSEAHVAMEKARAANSVPANHPSLVEVHFGKNSATPLGALTAKQVSWYAEVWEPGGDGHEASDADKRLKAAARAIHEGYDNDAQWEVNFA